MKSSSLRIGAAGSCFAVALTALGTASADWPTSRHDTRRTGVSATGSDIKQPASYWRARLGGALSTTQIYVGDVNKDGVEDVLFITGGRLTLADIHGNVLWRTASRGYLNLMSVIDLDLDGQLDVIVSTTSSISIVNAVTGQVAWDEPAAEIGTPGALRVGDLDGDGRPDLWLDTCGCCAIETGSPGVLYGFAGGVGSPIKLGTPPARGHCGAASNTLADLDGDGHGDDLDGRHRRDDVSRRRHHRRDLGCAPGARVRRPVRGGQRRRPARRRADLLHQHRLQRRRRARALRARLSPRRDPGAEAAVERGGQRARHGRRARPHRPGGRPGRRRAPRGGGQRQGQRRLHHVHPGRRDRRPARDRPRDRGGRRTGRHDGAAVADGHGGRHPERDRVHPPSGHRERGLDALGPARLRPARLGPRADVGLRGVAPHAGSQRRRPAGPGDALGLGAHRPLRVRHEQRTPGALGQYAIDPGVNASAVGASTGFAASPNLFAARNDGFVALLDGTLAPINLGKEGSATLPGMYVGGYYTGPGAFSGFGRVPIAGKLKPGDAGDAVLVVDSRGDLVRINPAGATNVSPAQATWRLPDSFGAGLQPAGAGAASIGAYRRRHPVTDAPQYVLASIDADGHELASLTLPRPPLWDVLPGDFAGDGSTSFVGFDIDGALNTDITAMSASGQQVWQQSFVSTSGSQPIAAGDWDGDGALDVAAVITAAHVYSGKTGAVIATGPDPFTYFVPILADIAGGPELDMVLQGGYTPVRALGHDLKSLWVSSGPKAPFPYGALAPCGSGAMLVEGTYTTPSQLTLTQASGASAGATSSVILASGAAYPDKASASAANATLGQLTDVAVSLNLAGAGTGPIALVGSTDGYLYAVDACTGALRWSLPFGVPVGSPILADSDGDGKDEILVSVADGYLYALKDQVLPAPSFVWDTDPPHGITDKDVDEIQSMTTLYATWAPVPGAASYEIAVVDAGGAYVTSPSWIDGGTVTSAAIPNLALFDGAKYFVGVRAVSPQGKSPDTPSNGVVVHFATMDGGSGGTGGTTGTGTGGTGGAPAGSGGAAPDPILLSGRACTCGTPGAGHDLGLGALGVLAAVAAWARRRRPITACR